MNGNYNNYDHIIFDNGMEREEKRRKMRSVFSRAFLALFVYLLSFQLIGALVYVIAPMILTEAQYAAFEASTVATVLVSSGVQYLIAFPIFLMITRGMNVSEKKEKKKLSVGECVIFLAAAEALMFIGNMIGTFLNSVMGTFLGEMPENGVETIVEETPAWLIFILLVVIGPIVEEIIFRKILIDRLSVYGDHVAIIFSAVAFGLMHGNLYQLFYATLLGLLLGYVYTSTRDVKYTIVIHMILNLLGSIVALPVQKAYETFYELLDALYAGLEFSMAELVTSGVITFIYSAFQYGLVVSGIIAILYRFRRREIRISTDKEIYLPDGEITKGGVVNAGSILFILLSAVFMVLNLF